MKKLRAQLFPNLGLGLGYFISMARKEYSLGRRRQAGPKKIPWNSSPRVLRVYEGVWAALIYTRTHTDMKSQRKKGEGGGTTRGKMFWNSLSSIATMIDTHTHSGDLLQGNNNNNS